MIIGISGYARAGKDEIAEILVEDFGFKRIAFADKLRDVLYALNPMLVGWFQSSKGQVTPQVTLQDVIDEFGWNGYKETPYGPEIRRLLQRLGTEAGRQTLWDSIWVDAALKDYQEGDRLVVPDMRFPNEFDAIKARGGMTWRVNREGVGPANNHESEVALDNHHFAVTINNNWSLEDLRSSVSNVMHDYSKEF